MDLIKNIQFTRLFKVGGYLKEFNFRKSNATQKGKASIDTIDERGNRIMFFIEKSDTGWKILPQELPQWIMDLEEELSSIMLEELPG
jgi:hypothetical protein